MKDKYIRGINLIKNNSSYFLFNAHGDVVHLTDSTGAVTKRYHYDAFGNEVSPSASDGNPWRYCGEYFDGETGTVYLRARYYDPRTGRFGTEDTHWNPRNMIYGDNPVLLKEYKDVLGLSVYTYAPSINAIRQSSNLYLYCGNNPMMFVDPNGTFWFITAAIGAVVGAVVAGVSNVVVQGLTNGWNDINIGEALIAAGSGALSGGLAGSGAGIVLVIAGNAAIGAGSYAATQAVTGQSITVSGLLVNAGVGAIFGAIGGSSKMQVKELKALYQAYRTAMFNSGKEINKMLFRDLFMKEMVKSPILQGVRDEVIQFFLDGMLQTDFSKEILNDVDTVFKRIIQQN